MKDIQFNEVEEKVLNNFWQGVGVGIAIGVIVFT